MIEAESAAPDGVRDRAGVRRGEAARDLDRAAGDRALERRRGHDHVLHDERDALADVLLGELGELGGVVARQFELDVMPTGFGEPGLDLGNLASTSATGPTW